MADARRARFSYRTSALDARPGRRPGRVPAPPRDPAEIRREVCGAQPAPQGGAADQPPDVRKRLQESRSRARRGADARRVRAQGPHVGGARISPRHANFIENVDGATALDALELMAEARRRASSSTASSSSERWSSSVTSSCRPPASSFDATTCRERARGLKERGWRQVVAIDAAPGTSSRNGVAPGEVRRVAASGSSRAPVRARAGSRAVRTGHGRMATVVALGCWSASRCCSWRSACTPLREGHRCSRSSV